jgi:hypothetical protein
MTHTGRRPAGLHVKESLLIFNNLAKICSAHLALLHMSETGEASVDTPTALRKDSALGERKQKKIK